MLRASTPLLADPVEASSTWPAAVALLPRASRGRRLRVSVRAALLAVATAMTLATAPAFAQDDPAELRAPSPDRADEAWAGITELLGAQRFAEAEVALRAFVDAHPDDVRAALADGMADALHDALARPTDEVAVTGQAGRLEVVTFSTLWGAGTGALLGFEIIDGGDDGKVPIWTAVGGGALSLTLSVLLTADDPPTRNQGSLISSAGVWGYVLGTELVFGTPISVCDHDDFWGEECEPNSHVARLVPFAMSSAAVVGGILYGRANPDVPLGDIAVVNAAGAWGFATSMMIMAAADANTERGPADFMLAGTTVGLATGLALTPFVSLSRSRMWLINLSGALGTGLAAAITATTETDDTRAWGYALLAGETVGLATGALVTVGRDRLRRRNREVALQLAPGPVSDGQSTGMGLTLGGTW